MKKVLFLCTHNSARSQMAEGLLRAMYGHKYDVYSAGTAPTRVDPDAIKAMSEVGIDISRQRSKGMDDVKDIQFDMAITVCDSAKGACPFFPGAKETFHRGFEDPAACEGEARIDAFRRARDQMRMWISGSFGSC